MRIKSHSQFGYELVLLLASARPAPPRHHNKHIERPDARRLALIDLNWCVWKLYLPQKTSLSSLLASKKKERENLVLLGICWQGGVGCDTTASSAPRVRYADDDLG